MNSFCNRFYRFNPIHPVHRGLAVAGMVALAFAAVANAQKQNETAASQYHAAPEPFQQYTLQTLVSNISGDAAVVDPNLANAWGLSRSSGGDWWVSDNTTGLSTLYDGTGKITPLVVTIPPGDPNASSTGTPTGTIFNGTTDFAVAAGKPAVFLFSTEDGTISGWNPGAAATKAIIVVNEKQKSVFKGLTAGQAGPQDGPLANYLYAADFRAGRVAVYDKGYKHVGEIENNFLRFSPKAGFAPFNVQNIGGNIYVAYAKQDSAKHDEIDGKGLGYVAVFRSNGEFIQELEPGGWMNAPWGLVEAPSDFGAYSHDILVGNFGSGEIAAFDPVSGSFRGYLRDSTNKVIQVRGLWGLVFGNGAVAGPATTLYFGAGPHGEQDGAFGTLTAVQNVAGNDL